MLVAAGLAMALTACGGSATTATSATKKPTTSTTTVPKYSVAEVASKIAQERARIEKLKTDMDDCPSADDMQALTCALVVQRAPVEGKLTLKAWGGMMGSRMPDELVALFNESYGAATDLSMVDVTGCEDGKFSAECSEATYQAKGATDALLAKFDGWGPYS